MLLYFETRADKGRMVSKIKDEWCRKSRRGFALFEFVKSKGGAGETAEWEARVGPEFLIN